MQPSRASWYACSAGHPHLRTTSIEVTSTRCPSPATPHANATTARSNCACLPSHQQCQNATPITNASSIALGSSIIRVKARQRAKQELMNTRKYNVLLVSLLFFAPLFSPFPSSSLECAMWKHACPSGIWSWHGFWRCWYLHPLSRKHLAKNPAIDSLGQEVLTWQVVTWLGRLNRSDGRLENV